MHSSKAKSASEPSMLTQKHALLNLIVPHFLTKSHNILQFWKNKKRDKRQAYLTEIAGQFLKKRMYCKVGLLAFSKFKNQKANQ